MLNFSRLRKKTFQLLEGDIYKSLLAKHVNLLLIVLILANVIAVILGSDDEISLQYSAQFSFFEILSTCIFSIEYLVRVWCCVENKQIKYHSLLKKRFHYLISPIAVVDLIAIAPFFISFFIMIDLRYLLLLRILRLLKLTHYFKGFNIFLTVIVKELKNIAAAIMVMMFLIIIAASLMYTLESKAQPEVFGNISHSLWWAVVTMTTVGYGDVTPVTILGKIVATIIMLIGVALVALPTAILAAGLIEELRERKRNLDAHVKDVLADGIIDRSEYRELKEITEKLELRPEDLKRTITFLKSEKCPHCGKYLLSKPDSPSK
ncbi:MAG: ion transporter [Psychromonas sp.]|nr:ion transporter [Psychromonas sp.]